MCKRISLLFFILLLTGLAQATDFEQKSNCKKLLLSRSDASDQYIAYLAMLIEENIIGDVELKRLMLGELPITANEARINSAKFIHRMQLERKLKESQIDLQKIIVWAQEQLQLRNRDQIERKSTQSATIVPFRLPKFYEIPVGKFRMGEKPNDPNKSTEVAIEKSFQMSDILVTQWLFAMVTGENPSWFAKGSGFEMVNGKQVEMQADHPVEWLNFGQVKEFLSKLNSLSENNDPLMYIIIPDHIKDARYELPTEAQWEYVARNLGTENGKYGFGDVAKIDEYAWYLDNSPTEELPHGTSHPVAQKKPMIIAGHAFYDIFGNVAEWCTDGSAMRGGNWNEHAHFLATASRNTWHDGSRFPYAGFRLIRHLP